MLRQNLGYLSATKPTEEAMIANGEVYLLTPPNWNPHNTAYAQNEASMLDWQGELKPPKDRQQILLSEITEDLPMSSAYAVGSIESKTVIQILDDAETKFRIPFSD